MEINLTDPIYIPDWIIPAVVLIAFAIAGWQLYRIFFPEPCFQFPEEE